MNPGRKLFYTIIIGQMSYKKQVKNFMLILLNTAKTFTQDPPSGWITTTEPIFQQESDVLVHELQKYSIPQLEKLMKISISIAQLNHNRYANWSACQRIPALHAFAGEIYKKLDSSSLSKKGWEFAQNHLRIISGLYGLLKPMDAINPYRLEMYTKLKVSKAKDLYAFWKEKIARQVNIELTQSGSKFLINLASNEYFSAIDAKKIEVPIVNVVFKDKTEKGLRTVAIRSKWARGLMTRYIIDHQITNPEQIKRFDLEGYEFMGEGSDEVGYLFVRS